MPGATRACFLKGKRLDIIRVEGGHAIEGRVVVSGAKNSALKLMAATLLAPGATTLENVPNISDVHVMGKVLKRMGATIDVLDEHTLRIDTSAVDSYEAPYDLVAKMRASTAVMGPLLGRFGKAKIAMPGGCNLGARKIDMHILGLEALGVSFTTFSAQNFGARNYERMRKGYHTSLVLSFMLIGGLSAVLLVFSGPLSRLFVDDASISAYTTTILHFIAPFYAIFSIIENASGSIRGAGVSFQPMMLTIFGTVVLRVIWVFAIMPFDPSLEHLLLVYPVTWLITATMFTIYHHSGNWLGRATA